MAKDVVVVTVVKMVNVAVVAAKKLQEKGCLCEQNDVASQQMTDVHDPSLSDTDLLVAYAAGNSDAARLLATRLLPSVLGQATRMLSDRIEAEDVAQEAMMRLWKIAPDWREGEAQISTWLYRVVANLCTDRLRKRQRASAVGIDQIAEPADPGPGVADQMQTNARMAALSDALGQLPDRQAQAVSLRHLEGLANPEIAQIMDISVRSVESLTARGKRALASILAGRRAALGYEDD